MSNIGATSGNRAVGGFGASLKEVGSKIKEGISAIGGKFAAFGGSVSSAIKGMMARVSGAGANAHPAGASAPVLKGSTFSALEKQNHMSAAQGSAFFQALAGSTTEHITAQDFRGIAAAVLTTPSSVAAMKAYGVTLDEAVAISMYTSQNFKAINGELRAPTGKPEIQALAAAFASGLAKLPSFDGNPKLAPNGQTHHECFRGAILERQHADNYRVNNQVVEHGILSSTFDQGQEFRDANFSISLLLKPGSQGKDISMFSDKPTECEVAFPPGVSFRVVSRNLDSGGLLSPAQEGTYHPATRKEGGSGMRCDLVMVEV